jgi:transcriptional regulator with XRE-family HTH domain
MNEMLHFGYHLRSVRQQRKYSQRTLATAAGIAVSFLAKIEMGKASPMAPTPEKHIKVYARMQAPIELT